MSKRAFFTTGACAGVGAGVGAATGGLGVAAGAAVGAGVVVGGSPGCAGVAAGLGVAAGAGVPGAGVAGNAGAVRPGIGGAGVGSGSDTHPATPIVAMAPAIARDLMNLRLPIAFESISLSKTSNTRISSISFFSPFLFFESPFLASILGTYYIYVTMLYNYLKLLHFSCRIEQMKVFLFL